MKTMSNNSLDTKAKIKSLLAERPIKFCIIKTEGNLITFRFNAKEVVEQIMLKITQCQERS